MLNRLNPALETIQCSRRFSPEDLLAKSWDTLTEADFRTLADAGWQNASYVKKYRTEALQSTVHYFMRFRIPDSSLEHMLNGILTDPVCGRILRIKGSFQSDDGSWHKLNAVNGKTEIAPVPEGQAVIIVIGEHLSLDAIDRHFRAVNLADGYVCI